MARCQVCDGPVVNGRCKLCGMPYRNDEVLYHLNESRDDHYKHATPKAKAQMRANAHPDADRNVQQNRAAAEKSRNAGKSRTAAGGNKGNGGTADRTAGKTARAASADTIRSIGAGAAGRTAYQTRTVIQNQKSTAQEILDKRVQERRQSYETGKMQKSAKKRSGLSVALALIFLAAGVLPGMINTAKEKYENVRSPEVSWTEGDGLVDTDELTLRAILDAEDPEIVVTDTYGSGKIMPGEYVITIPEDGYLEILVQYAESRNSEKFVFEDTDDQAALRLSKGDSVSLTGYDNKTNYALFYQIEQYDESTDI